MILRTVPTDPDHDQDAEDDLFYRDTLQGLVHVGATLANLLQTQAIADAQAVAQGLAPATPLGDHAATFDRISRAVRRSIALARSLRHPAPGPQSPATGAAQRPSGPAEARASQPVPVRPGNIPLDDPAEAIAMLPRHPVRPGGRWQPPPAG